MKHKILIVSSASIIDGWFNFGLSLSAVSKDSLAVTLLLRLPVFTSLTTLENSEGSSSWLTHTDPEKGVSIVSLMEVKDISGPNIFDVCLTHIPHDFDLNHESKEVVERNSENGFFLASIGTGDLKCQN